MHFRCVICSRCDGIKQNTVIVKWYGEIKHMYSKVKTLGVDILAENKIDAMRAARNEMVHILYQCALYHIITLLCFNFRWIL